MATDRQLKYIRDLVVLKMLDDHSESEVIEHFLDVQKEEEVESFADLDVDDASQLIDELKKHEAGSGL